MDFPAGNDRPVKSKRPGARAQMRRATGPFSFLPSLSVNQPTSLTCGFYSKVTASIESPWRPNIISREHVLKSAADLNTSRIKLASTIGDPSKCAASFKLEYRKISVHHLHALSYSLTARAYLPGYNSKT